MAEANTNAYSLGTEFMFSAFPLSVIWFPSSPLQDLLRQP